MPQATLKACDRTDSFYVISFRKLPRKERPIERKVVLKVQIKVQCCYCSLMPWVGTFASQIYLQLLYLGSWYILSKIFFNFDERC